MRLVDVPVRPAPRSGRALPLHRSESRLPVTVPRSVVPSSAPPVPDRHPTGVFWRGHTGRVYRHEIHDFIHCPVLPRATYVLARRDRTDGLIALHVGTATSLAPTLNLAHIRRLGARLGATEVHIHPTPHARGTLAQRRIARDLRAALLGG